MRLESVKRFTPSPASGVVSAMLAALLVTGGASSAQAQAAYPSKPIRLLVGFAAGGATDVISRVIGAKMGDALGQPIVIENRPGVSSNIATLAAARAAPDGYTLLMGTNSNAANESLFKDARFKFADDFTPIALLAAAPCLIVSHPTFEAKTVQEIIELARARPGQLSYGTGGPGTIGHLAGELISMMSNVKMTAIPYRGGAEAVKDLLSGEVKLHVSTPNLFMPLIKAGKIRAIATTGPQRSGVSPDIPTVAESGFPGFDLRLWFGLVAPAGTPKDIVQKLAAAARVAIASPEVQSALAAQGYDPIVTGTPEDFAAFIRVEIDRAAKIVNATGMKPE